MLSSVLGIHDTYVWLAYLLCIASAILCTVYGAINWNRGGDSVARRDVEWADHEKVIEQEQ